MGGSRSRQPRRRGRFAGSTLLRKGFYQCRRAGWRPAEPSDQKYRMFRRNLYYPYRYSRCRAINWYVPLKNRGARLLVRTLLATSAGDWRNGFA